MKNTLSFIKSTKLVVIFLVIATMLMPLTSCGIKTEEAEDDSFMKKYETPEKLEPVTVKIMFPGVQPQNWPLVKEEIEKRSNEELNATIEFKWMDRNEYFQKMGVIDASQEIIDAFCLGKPDSFYPDFTKFAREEKLKDITELFPENASSLFSKYTQEELEYAKVDGKIYAVPSLYPYAYSTYLMVDDALQKKYNVPAIKDLDQYEAFLEAVKQNEPDLIPGTIANMVQSLDLFARAYDYVIVDKVQKLVYKWNDPKMKVVAWEQTPEFKEAVTRIIDWTKKGYIEAGPVLDQSKVASFVYYGQLNPPSTEPTKVSFSDGSGEIKESNPLSVYYLYPEKKIQRDNAMGSFFFNGSFVFPITSPNTERALRFLNWVHESRDNYYLTMYGAEGRDYVLNQGYPTFPPGMDYSSRSYLFWDGSWALSSVEYQPEIKDAYGTGMNTQKDFLDKYSMHPPHGAFYPNFKTMQEAADGRARAFQEFEYQLSTGAINDFSQVNTFIAKLEDLGSASLVGEVQHQMDNR